MIEKGSYLQEISTFVNLFLMKKSVVGIACYYYIIIIIVTMHYYCMFL